MKIFLLCDDATPRHKVDEASQLLQEYDFEVIDPTVVQGWEEFRYPHLSDDEKLKRSIRMMLFADGVCFVSGEPPMGSALCHSLWEISLRLPWLIRDDDDYIKTLDEWIEYARTDETDEDPSH